LRLFSRSFNDLLTFFAVAFFDVAFPAGANNIVWDPTLGQGDQLVAPSSASTVAISFLVALFAFLAILFF